MEERKRRVGRRVERSWVLPQLRAHADMIDPIGFEHFLRETAAGLELDVMLEAKAKDLALLRLREQQDSTGGFLSFIPLAFHPENTVFERRGFRFTTGADDLKVIAVSRLLLDNVPHVKAYWIMMGLPLAQVALHFGADDVQGTVVREKIFQAAGASAGTGSSTAAFVPVPRISPNRVAACPYACDSSVADPSLTSAPSRTASPARAHAASSTAPRSRPRSPRVARKPLPMPSSRPRPNAVCLQRGGGMG